MVTGRHVIALDRKTEAPKAGEGIFTPGQPRHLVGGERIELPTRSV